jgi:hypothetical protein
MAPPERNIHERTFPGHPHGQRANRVDRFLRMKANAPLPGTPGIIMKNAKTPKDFDLAIVHPDGKEELIFSLRPPQKIFRNGVQSEPIGNPIKLGLGHVKGVKWFFIHDAFPFSSIIDHSRLESEGSLFCLF